MLDFFETFVVIPEYVPYNTSYIRQQTGTEIVTGSILAF